MKHWYIMKSDMAEADDIIGVLLQSQFDKKDKRKENKTGIQLLLILKPNETHTDRHRLGKSEESETSI